MRARSRAASRRPGPARRRGPRRCRAGCPPRGRDRVGRRAPSASPALVCTRHVAPAAGTEGASDEIGQIARLPVRVVGRRRRGRSPAGPRPSAGTGGPRRRAGRRPVGADGDSSARRLRSTATAFTSVVSGERSSWLTSPAKRASRATRCSSASAVRLNVAARASSSASPRSGSRAARSPAATRAAALVSSVSGRSACRPAQPPIAGTEQGAGGHADEEHGAEESQRPVELDEREQLDEHSRAVRARAARPPATGMPSDVMRWRPATPLSARPRSGRGRSSGSKARPLVVQLPSRRTAIVVSGSPASPVSRSASRPSSPRAVSHSDSSTSRALHRGLPRRTVSHAGRADSATTTSTSPSRAAP